MVGRPRHSLGSQGDPRDTTPRLSGDSVTGDAADRFSLRRWSLIVEKRRSPADEDIFALQETL
jgi:hypothetical protein